jgi:hypothetical protein
MLGQMQHLMKSIWDDWWNQYVEYAHISHVWKIVWLTRKFAYLPLCIYPGHRIHFRHKIYLYNFQCSKNITVASNRRLLTVWSEDQLHRYMIDEIENNS